MDCDTALDRLSSHPHIERFKTLRAGPHGEDWCKRIIEIATGRSPGVFQQARAVVQAGGRVVAAAVQGKEVFVTDDVFNERESECLICPFVVKTDDGRFLKCSICKCKQMKLRIATEQCPLEPPRWKRIV
jgi:hypothetical protein